MDSGAADPHDGQRSPYEGPPADAVRLGSDEPPVLLTVLSTEEEFDWSSFSRSETSVEAARHIDRAQAVFDAHGVQPCYVVDYPIASQAHSVAPLKEIQDSGRCEIGAHLHPWVSPPFDEEVNEHNSFPGNLPAQLEEAKVAQLASRIEESFGRRPTTYQAGRYGFGPHTAGILERQGFRVDISASPAFDFSAEGGPDFSSNSSHAFWFGREEALLAVPVSGAYVGFLQVGPNAVHRFATSPSMSWSRLSGVLSRVGALERLRLSPEGFDLADNKKLTRFLLDRGVKVFVFSFHSPSVQPGCTPYVKDKRELEDFLGRCRQYYDYFLGELGGRSMTPTELREHLLPLRTSRTA